MGFLLDLTLRYLLFMLHLELAAIYFVISSWHLSALLPDSMIKRKENGLWNHTDALVCWEEAYSSYSQKTYLIRLVT